MTVWGSMSPWGIGPPGMHRTYHSPRTKERVGPQSMGRAPLHTSPSEKSLEVMWGRAEGHRPLTVKGSSETFASLFSCLPWESVKFLHTDGGQEARPSLGGQEACPSLGGQAKKAAGLSDKRAWKRCPTSARRMAHSAEAE